jgi:hypothetical protein
LNLTVRIGSAAAEETNSRTAGKKRYGTERMKDPPNDT